MKVEPNLAGWECVGGITNPRGKFSFFMISGFDQLMYSLEDLVKKVSDEEGIHHVAGTLTKPLMTDAKHAWPVLCKFDKHREGNPYGS